jgi:hypothetical protein
MKTRVGSHVVSSEIHDGTDFSQSLWYFQLESSFQHCSILIYHCPMWFAAHTVGPELRASSLTGHLAALEIKRGNMTCYTHAYARTHTHTHTHTEVCLYTFQHYMAKIHSGFENVKRKPEINTNLSY